MATDKERIEELESQLAIARSASRANWHRFVKAQEVIYSCFRWMDVSLDIEMLTALNKHFDWYKDGCDIIGWNYDWSREAYPYGN